MSKLLLIDGNSITYRAYYGSAYGHTGILRTSFGMPTNAILTVNRMIANVIEKINPTHVLIAFDAGKKTRRHEKYAEYKAGRSVTPAELIIQFPLVKEMFGLMGIKTFELTSIEADDIIASAATQFAANEIFILSSDRDLLQLVNSKTSVIMPQNGSKEATFVTTNNFLEIVGVKPSQVPDLKAIMGDSSDNLPGVKGIGEKGAIKLIEKYASIENVYAHIEEQTDSVATKLKASKDMAFLCKELATLFCNITLPFEFETIHFTTKINKELLDFFAKYELNSLYNKYKPLLEKSEYDLITF